MAISIILTILKILGIILLSILGLLILIVLLVLFVPINYKLLADADMDTEKKEYHFMFTIFWPLFWVKGKYKFPSEDGFVLKIGPFKVIGGQKKEKKKSTKEKKRKIKEVEFSQSNDQIEENTEETIRQDKIGEKQKDVDLLEDLLEEDTQSGFKAKIIYTWSKICDKINKIREKIKDIYKNVKKYLAILESDEFKDAFMMCKSSLVRIFKMLKPRKVKIEGCVGLNDPQQTGYICGIVGILSVFYKKHIQITPDFEQFIIRGKAKVKGRVYLIVLVSVAIKAFFDKNIRKVLEMFRKEES